MTDGSDLIQAYHAHEREAKALMDSTKKGQSGKGKK